MRTHRDLFSVGIVVLILGIFLLVGTGKAHVDDVVSIFLPLIFNGESGPLSTTPTPTMTPTQGLISTQTPTPTLTTSPEPEPIPDDIACLFVIGKKLSGELPPLYAGCAPTQGGPIETNWSRDAVGRYVGVTYRIWDATQTNILYEADMVIDYYSTGRLKSYSGTVIGDSFASFRENVINRYLDSGKLLGADITKIYDLSGDVYQLDLHEYCPNSLDVSGYVVSLDGTNYAVGSCQ